MADKSSKIYPTTVNKLWMLDLKKKKKVQY